MAHLNNPMQQKDLLEEYEMNALWAKVEKTDEKKPKWLDLKMNEKQLMDMTRQIKNTMPDEVTQLIFSFAMWMHPDIKIPWNNVAEEQAFWWEELREEYYGRYQNDEWLDDAWHDGEKDDDLDRPFCHNCGEMNFDMTYSLNPYKRNQYMRNRSQLCYKCKILKFKVREVEPTYKIIRCPWKNDFDHPDDDVHVRYYLTKESFLDHDYSLLTLMQSAPDKADTRLILKEWHSSGTVRQLTNRIVSMNYRSVVRGRVVYDMWVRYDRPNGELRFMLRRMYTFMNHPYIFECTHSCLRDF
jgi:hypothetical protein